MCGSKPKAAAVPAPVEVEKPVYKADQNAKYKIGASADEVSDATEDTTGTGVQQLDPGMTIGSFAEDLKKKYKL